VHDPALEIDDKLAYRIELCNFGGKRFSRS